MQTPGWKVGELARQTGLSIRTLHYYDEIGLLTPAQHTASGHRLYTAADIARLQQIQSLRQLGFSLKEIRGCLQRADFAPLRVLQLHIERLREQIDLQQRLCQRLEILAASLQRAETVATADLLHTIEVMTMFEKYYTPEQLEQLRQREEAIGQERIREVEAEWPRLMAQVQAEMERGTDPASPQVQELARRWRLLVEEFTGGDPAIEQSLRTMYEKEPAVAGMETGPMRQMAEYIRKALAAAPEAG